MNMNIKDMCYFIIDQAKICARITILLAYYKKVLKMMKFTFILSLLFFLEVGCTD